MSSSNRRKKIKKLKKQTPSRTMTDKEWSKAINDRLKGSDATIIDFDDDTNKKPNK